MEIILSSPILIWLIVINTISVFICIADKIKAKKHRRRISEKTLFLLSFLGGALFMYVTMRLIRHKTLHKKFMIGLPAIIIAHCIIAILVLKYAPYLIFTV